MCFQPLETLNLYFVSLSCCWYETKNKNARCVIRLDLSLCILIISLQIQVGPVGVRKGGIGDEPEFHLVVGEVSLSHLVG